jgi:hypothetical protein
LSGLLDPVDQFALAVRLPELDRIAVTLGGVAAQRLHVA